MSDEEAQEHFDNFFEDVFVECEDKVRISFFLPCHCLINTFVILYSMVKLKR
jgi:hypothetical protein